MVQVYTSTVCFVLLQFARVIITQQAPSDFCSQAITNYDQCLDIITVGINDVCSGICRDAYKTINETCRGAVSIFSYISC